MAIIKPKRGDSTALANSGTNQYELKYTTDTKDLYIYDGSNVNVTSKEPVVVTSNELDSGDSYIITETNKFRFLNIHTKIGTNTKHDHYFRLPKAMYPTDGYPVTYIILLVNSTTIEYANVTIQYYNSTSFSIRHNHASLGIKFTIVKEY